MAEEDGPIIHKEGYLAKSPPLIQPRGSWKTRYFRLLQGQPNGDFGDIFLEKIPKKSSKRMRKLYEYYLIYWDNEDMTKRPRKAIPLLGTYQVTKFPLYEEMGKNMISLTTKDRIYLLRARDEADMNSWYEKLTAAIEDVKGKSLQYQESSFSDSICEEGIEDEESDSERTFSNASSQLSSVPSRGSSFRSSSSGSSLRRSCSLPSVIESTRGRDQMYFRYPMQDSASSKELLDNYDPSSEVIRRSICSLFNPIQDCASSREQLDNQDPSSEVFRRSLLSLLFNCNSTKVLPPPQCQTYDVVNEPLKEEELEVSNVMSSVGGNDVMQPPGIDVIKEMNITAESMRMACFQSQVKKLIESGENIIEEGLKVAYGQYEVTITRK